MQVRAHRRWEPLVCLKKKMKIFLPIEF
jgi:hypothetical protein